MDIEFENLNAVVAVVVFVFFVDVVVDVYFLLRPRPNLTKIIPG